MYIAAVICDDDMRAILYIIMSMVVKTRPPSTFHRPHQREIDVINSIFVDRQSRRKEKHIDRSNERIENFHYWVVK